MSVFNIDLDVRDDFATVVTMTTIDSKLPLVWKMTCMTAVMSGGMEENVKKIFNICFITD